MDEEKKYPRAIVGAFIFNDKDELLLLKSVHWDGLYAPPGGSVELDETVINALKREVKEETNLSIEDIKFISITDGLGLYDNYKKPENHLIFLNYIAKAKDTKRIKLNNEATDYKWQSVEKWLKDDKMSPTCKNVLENSLIRKEHDFENLYKRALADYQNLAKQTAEEKASLVKYANEQLITEMIPVYDNLKTAIIFSDELSESNGWVEGIKHVIKQFKEVLENNGVREIRTTGQKFDHNKMEAAESKETDDKKKDEIVAKELRPGYELNGKIINAARVVVYKYNKNS